MMIVPAVALAQTGHALRQFALAVAGHAGNADDLATPYFQIDTAQRLGAAVAQSVNRPDRAGARRPPGAAAESSGLISRPTIMRQVRRV